ncbi:MAG: response regulator [Paludibacteraceae bacterium]|nr:response regulator [Paludibacteraceae bacterium]
MKFDLLITDIMMPRMNGFELAESVRAVDKTTPIIFMRSRWHPQQKPMC